jgi:hypothetical protein
MSLRRMTSRYSGRCKICRAPFFKGDVILWSKATGAQCLKHENAPAPAPKKSPKPKTPQTPIDFTIDWHELKEMTRDLFAGKKPNLRPFNLKKIEGLLLTPSESWHGYTRGQLERWVNEGYQTEAIKGLAEFTPAIRQKRRLRFMEEGDEFHADLAMAGEERFMSEWTKREVTPGISLDCTVDFSAFVSPEIVNAYNVWICRTVYSLESAGIDCEVTLSCPATHSIAGMARDAVTNQRVRVKKENEVTDFVSISAMLSPAAMRGFLFTCIALNADSQGKDVDSGLGGTVSHVWDVNYNAKDRRIEVTSMAQATSFPAEEMTRKFRAALKAAMGG